ncbi:hypothetical protein Hanom_Chr04g00325071 [Helianthus anomalus]
MASQLLFSWTPLVPGLPHLPVEKARVKEHVLFQHGSTLETSLPLYLRINPYAPSSSEGIQITVHHILVYTIIIVN